MIARYSTLIGLLVLLLPLDASAAGKCDAGGIYGPAAAAAREAVRARCDCAGAASHPAYEQCAWRVIQDVVAAGELPAMCRGRVRQFATRSTCGRDDVVPCCIKHGNGPWRPAIARRSEGCVPPRNGAACNALFAQLEYACLPDSACRYNVCGDGILDPKDGEGCEPPGVGLCDAYCQVIVCGNGKIDPGEQCEPPRTASCDPNCQTKHCGDGIVDPVNEECEPPNTPTCDAQCYILRACGNGVVDAYAGEECEPPGTATCDATCHFKGTCGNGVIEPGEECDGQAGCTADCKLLRSVCCDVSGGCLGGAVSDDFSAYFNFFKPCYLLVGGQGSYGVCEGTEACPPPFPPDIGCRVGSCGDAPIEPLPLCCQQAAGGCRAIVASTAGAVGGFGCGTFPPPEQGDIDRLMLGTCGADGRCVPAS